MSQYTLETYNAADHLVDIKDRSGNVKQYLPAAWRLVELRLRYPHITIESEIILLDVEHNLCIIKSWIYDGKTYADSERRASGTKQGLLSALDKVETAAKARAARDFGVSTELSLEWDEDITPSAGQVSTTEALASIKEQVKSQRLAVNPQQWAAWKKSILGADVADGKLTVAQIEKLRGGVTKAA